MASPSCELLDRQLCHWDGQTLNSSTAWRLMFCAGLDDEISTIGLIGRGPRHDFIDAAICTQTPQGGLLANPRYEGFL
jgi:hypothetical protein